MPSLAALGRRWPRRRALGPQDSTPQYGQGPSAKDPAASGVSLRRSPAPPGGSRRRPESREVSAVIVTLNALPWIERCLESVAAHETIVVDHGSTDGTVD